jgi:hypothetical protein
MLNSCMDSPRRSPNWRWLRAVEIDGGGPRASRAGDGEAGFEWIRRASRLKRHFERSNNNPNNLRALLIRDPAMFWAHSIWLEEREPTRWGIEARVLANETDAEIAEKLGTRPEIVSAYINVFFDVREKLNHPDYVINVILAGAVTRGLQERHYDLLWKLMGYHGGPHVLDAAINKFVALGKPATKDDVSGFLQDFAINSMKYKSAIAALTVQINTHTQLPLIDSFVKYVEIERTTENATKAHATIVENIGAMLSALPFKVGTKLDSEPLKMLPFDKGAAELKQEELMVLSNGGVLQDQSEIENLRFPGEK